MTSKRIIKKFTPENSFHLHYCNDEYMISPWITNNENNHYLYSYNKPRDTNELIPLCFNDLKSIYTIRKEYYNSNITNNFKKNIIQKFETDDSRVALIITTAFIVILQFILLINYINPKFNPHNVLLLTITYSIIMLIISIIEFCGVFKFIEKCEYSSRLLLEVESRITKKNKKKLYNTIILQLPYDISDSIIKNCKKSMNKICEILSYDKEILDTINLHNIENSYDNYVKLLTFTIVNEYNISVKLFNDYSKQLEELSSKLIKEAEDVLTIIKENEKYLEDNKIITNDIEQELLDNDALSFFPASYNK